MDGVGYRRFGFDTVDMVGMEDKAGQWGNWMGQGYQIQMGVVDMDDSGEEDMFLKWAVKYSYCPNRKPSKL